MIRQMQEYRYKTGILANVRTNKYLKKNENQNRLHLHHEFGVL